MKVIGISGPKGSGKTAVAQAVCYALQRDTDRNALNGAGSGYVQSFATPLKAMLIPLLQGIGMDGDALDEHIAGGWKESPIAALGGITTRRLMQTLGTEWGRIAVSPNLWVNLAKAKLESGVYERNSTVIFDDVRFRNEVKMIHSYGGVVFRLAPRAASGVGELHLSETEGTTLANVIPLTNGGTPEDAAKAVIKTARLIS